MEIDYLRNIPLFQTLSDAELSHVGESLVRVTYQTGETLCIEGEPGNSLFVIEKGTVEIIKALGEPTEQIISMATAGDFFGEMSLLDPNGVRNASVRARSPVEALKMTRESFTELLDVRPDFGFEVARVLALHVRDSNNQLHERYGELEIALRELRAAQAALIEKEKLERELQLAKNIQQDILPKTMPLLDKYNFGARMVPARAVGGDFFDFIQLSPTKVGVVVGDVSDKGVPAAIFMALTRSLMRAEARRTSSPIEVLQQVNELLLEMSEAGMFVTVLYGILDQEAEEFCYARAGHEIPLMVNGAGEFQFISHNPGQPLAMFDEPVFDLQTVKFSGGSTIFIYTDGVTDATNDTDEFFGLDRLTDSLKDLNNIKAETVCKAILGDVLAFQGGKDQYDDITLLAIHAL